MRCFALWIIRTRSSSRNNLMARSLPLIEVDSIVPGNLCRATEKSFRLIFGIGERIDYIVINSSGQLITSLDRSEDDLPYWTVLSSVCSEEWNMQDVTPGDLYVKDEIQDILYVRLWLSHDHYLLIRKLVDQTTFYVVNKSTMLLRDCGRKIWSSTCWSREICL